MNFELLSQNSAVTLVTLWYPPWNHGLVGYGVHTKGVHISFHDFLLGHFQHGLCCFNYLSPYHRSVQDESQRMCFMQHSIGLVLILSLLFLSRNGYAQYFCSPLYPSVDANANSRWDYWQTSPWRISLFHANLVKNVLVLSGCSVVLISGWLFSGLLLRVHFSKHSSMAGYIPYWIFWSCKIYMCVCNFPKLVWIEFSSQILQVHTWYY